MMVETSLVADVAVTMAMKRYDSALLIDSAGALAGILTDNDIARRVISQFLDPAEVFKVYIFNNTLPHCIIDNWSFLNLLPKLGACL